MGTIPRKLTPLNGLAELIYTYLFVCTLLHFYIQMRRFVIAINGDPATKVSIAMGITGQPQQDACACWPMERVLPVVECTLTYNPEEPGTAVIVDGIGLELVAGKRVIVVCIVNLEITCT